MDSVHIPSPHHLHCHFGSCCTTFKKNQHIGKMFKNHNIYRKMIFRLSCMPFLETPDRQAGPSIPKPSGNKFQNVGLLSSLREKWSHGSTTRAYYVYTSWMRTEVVAIRRGSQQPLNEICGIVRLQDVIRGKKSKPILRLSRH